MKELEDHYYTLGVIAVSFKTLVLPYTDMLIHVLIIFLNVFCGKISGTNIFPHALLVLFVRGERP
jgi:3-hydroxymyristoyl/3-hydroxydecanoyl-(acyl carrier protein) dehydratase